MATLQTKKIGLECRHVWIRNSDHKKGWCHKAGGIWNVGLEKIGEGEMDE